MGKWLDAAADLLLGAQCPGCGEAGLGCCRSCCAALEAGRLQLWRPAAVRGAASVMPTVHAAGSYVDVTRQLLTAYKERQAWWLAPRLGRRLGLAVAAGLDAAGWSGPVLLVPVPSAPATVRERGLDTTAEMADQAARWLRRQGLDVRSGRRLRHRRRVADQAELGAAERWHNLSGALTGRVDRADRFPARRWVGVDDVATTGASLAEAARASAAAGAEVLFGAVVAATQGRAQVDGQ